MGRVRAAAKRVVARTPLHHVARALNRTPIFQIGFNKCATTSLHRFLIDSGIPSLHWRDGDLARRIAARMDAGQDPIRDFPGNIGFTDMMAVEPGRLIEPYKRFDYLHRWYPQALFVLNTRELESWIASRAAHAFRGERLLDVYANKLGIPEAGVLDFWRSEWRAHHALARAYFRDAPNFLEFNIERDDPEKLIAFIARRWPRCASTPFRTHNRSDPD